jgi:hypothetical protein
VTIEIYNLSLVEMANTGSLHLSLRAEGTKEEVMEDHDTPKSHNP